MFKRIARRIAMLALAVAAAPPVRAAEPAAATAQPSAEDYRADALALVPMIAENYAYLDRFPDGKVPTSPKLRAEAEAVRDRASLIRYAERQLMAIADHHAITGPSLPDSWGLVPSFADLWIERDAAGDYRVTAVKPGTPAGRAGIAPGSKLVAVGGVATAQAVDAFWADLGLTTTAWNADFAARVLATGLRDRPRHLTIEDPSGTRRELTLDNLYAAPQPDEPPVDVRQDGVGWTIHFANSLGDNGTIAAFDAAMAQVPPGAPLTIDLTDTPSGGNTAVARAVMGWFVIKDTPYQVHSLPGEFRETGIERKWIELVMPRAGKFHPGPVRVLVGRWTGSMGEGLAVGLAACGATLEGDRMAGLRGAIYDLTLDKTGFVFKLPVERIETVDGVPREDVVPKPVEASARR